VLIFYCCCTFLPECKHCHSKARQHGECQSGSTTDTVQCTCEAGFVGDGVQCSMSRSYNNDLVLETRKNYFYWARQLEKRLPIFKEAKDAYVAAASSFTEWLYESGGQGGAGKATHLKNQPGSVSKNVVTGALTRLKMREQIRQGQGAAAPAGSGSDTSRLLRNIYQQLKRRKQTIKDGPMHDSSGEGRGRHEHDLNSGHSDPSRRSPDHSRSWSEGVNITQHDNV
jgi:hypothetical protein